MWKVNSSLTPLILVNNGLPQGASVSKIENTSELNSDSIKEGYKPPYVANTDAVQFATDKPTDYVRYYYKDPATGKDNQSSTWMVRAEDVQGLSPEQVASKYSLGYIPNMKVDITVPAGQTTRASTASDIQYGNGIGGNGGGGGVQFEVLIPKGTKIPPSWFGKSGAP